MRDPRPRLLRELPAPSLLVVAGLAVGLLPGFPQWQLAPEVVTLGVLPPLLFAAAQQISPAELRAVWLPVAALAVGLVAASALAVAGVGHAVDGSVGLAAAFTIGAVLSSTDPVAVTALSRRLRLPERLATLVQSESLFNDATSLVLFQVAVAGVTAGHIGAGHASWLFARLGGGGVLVGAVVGGAAGLALRRTRRVAVVVAVDVAVPYAAALAAHALGMSAVTAVIVTGLAVAGPRGRQPEHLVRRRVVIGFARAVLVLENAVFAVIGVELAVFLRELPAGRRGTAAAMTALVTVAVLAVRALALAGAALALTVRRGRSATAYRPWQAAAVVTWAGTRGVVPLAAALSIPLATDAGRPFPHRPLLLVVAIASVVLTLVVQGTTLRPLVTRLGVAAPRPEPEG